MSLFQKSVEKKYLNELDSTIIEQKYLAFQSYFGNPVIQENIRNSKEEQFQEGFLRELFVNILGYTLNPQPNFNLTTELKNVSNSKKADGAILKGEYAVAVIELKSTNTTDLDSIETQAFGYKNHHPKCIYVITSNFEKIRLYIQNAVDHIDFNLFKLTKEQFSLMWLCISKDNLLSDLPLTIKESSVLREESITKKLYADYSKFRASIYNNLVKNNPEKDKLLLFRKTQKLLDRFLFIFFAEDRLLLPPNSISDIVKQWEGLRDDYDEYFPLYDRFKKYFGYLNTGFKGKKYDIYPYNGGLFAPDEVLDSVLIEDDILHEHTLKLSSYDFETDVDVNILGHIFENSLGEIESVQAEIKGEKVDAQKTKRKKDGIFYTPNYITKYIVENTVGKLCSEKRNELSLVSSVEFERKKDGKLTKKAKDYYALLEKYREWLLTLTILDPACGSGAFLNQSLEFLLIEHEFVTVQMQNITGDISTMFLDIEKHILEKNIFGVDLNEESVEIAKLSLWLRTAQKGRKLNTLSNNIKCGNSLIDDPNVAGEKAFKWEKEFPEIFQNGGFDVVVGNPPYVRAELLGEFREYLEENFKVYNPAGDLFSYFYEHSFKLLKPNGLFGFISNTFDKTTAGVSIREFMQREVQFLKYIDFTEVQIFEGATTYPIILIAKNKILPESSFDYIKIPKASQAPIIDIAFHEIVSVFQITLENNNWSFKSRQAVELIDKLKRNKTIKEIYGKCYYGVKTALNEAFIIPKSHKISEHVKPIYEGKELEKWISSESVQQLILFESKWTKKVYGDGVTEELAIENLKSEFPELISQILQFEERAKKRYDQGEFFWELRNCAYYHLFELPKVVFPNLQNSNKFSYDETGAYINAPAVILPTNDKFLVSILNSKLIWYFLTNICVVRSGGYIEVKPQYFEQIPIPDISDTKKEIVLEKTETIIQATQKSQELSNKFLKLLMNRFEEISLTKKLENWYDLSFTNFEKELKKQKINLSLLEESEWMDFFAERANSYNELSEKIKKYENEINQITYELYGLTEEEIRIVENEI